MTVELRAVRHLLAGVLLSGALAAATAPLHAEPLERYAKLDRSGITVSGISSGGFFAHQFHIAFSGMVQGAGLVAGGPYGCAEQAPLWLTFNPLRSVMVALAVCTQEGRREFGFWGGMLPEAPDAERSAKIAFREHAAGAIDDPANLRDDRVWLFSGGRDKVVGAPVADALRSFYQRAGILSANIVAVRNPGATHGMPIEAFAGQSRHPLRRCDEDGPPFLIDCDFDGPGALLQHLYASGWNAQPGSPDRQRLLPFDQTGFFDPADAAVSMASTGYVYVPSGCENGSTAAGKCRLHVAFHGCRQHEAEIDDDFFWDAGYNRWAESNRIIVLYPQAIPWNRASDPTRWNANPRGCWDWWGYSGPDYHRRTGKQMAAVKAMVDRLLP